MICFIIPFVSLYSLFSKPAIDQSPIVQYIPAIEEMTIQHTDAWVTEPAFTMNIIYVVIITAGMLFMLGRCLVQFYSLFRMRAKAKLLYDSTVKLYHIDKPVVPFSFGNAIYINQHQHSQQELSEIIRHEFIHVKQRHSIDMIWSELLCIVNWYNPFAWLLRKAIRQNLEFIADHQVLQSGLDRKQYQYLLLKVIGSTSFSIANKFNFSSLKKRIAMMNKTKSARVNLLRFAFILPLLAVILLAFRNVVHHQPMLRPPHAPYGEKIDTVPARKTYTMPDNVQSVDVEYTGTKNGRITVTLKNGEVEKYDLSKEKEKKAFEDKYGALPEPPVPPIPPLHPVTIVEPSPVPAVPATPDASPISGVAPVPAQSGSPAIAGVAPVPAAPATPGAPAAIPYHTNSDDCFNKKGYCITIADNQGESVVIVKNKELKIVEAIALTDWNNNKRYTEKYGDIPSVHLKLKPVAPDKPTPSVGPSPAKAEGHQQKVVVADTAEITNANVKARITKDVLNRIAGIQNYPVEFMINKNTTKENIEQFDRKLHDHGYTLMIRDIRFENGYLNSIDGFIGSNDGKRSATFTNDDLSQGQILIVSNKDEKGQNYLSINARNTPK